MAESRKYHNKIVDSNSILIILNWCTYFHSFHTTNLLNTPISGFFFFRNVVSMQPSCKMRASPFFNQSICIRSSSRNLQKNYYCNGKIWSRAREGLFRPEESDKVEYIGRVIDFSIWTVLEICMYFIEIFHSSIGLLTVFKCQKNLTFVIFLNIWNMDEKKLPFISISIYSLIEIGNLSGRKYCSLSSISSKTIIFEN